MLAELLVLTDFGACLLAELVCYLFMRIGRGRKKGSSSGLNTEPAMRYLLSLSATITRATNRHLKLVFSTREWYSRLLPDIEILAIDPLNKETTHSCRVSLHVA